VILIWVGVDDTDSTSGGCTTYVACMLIKELTKEKYDIIGYPRLVRLNPNIPWKTRGNGAVSFLVGKGEGKKTKIGEIREKEVFSYETSSDDSNYDRLKEIVEQVIEEYAILGDENTNSGFVFFRNPPSYEVYLKTVRGIVSLKEVKELLDSSAWYFKGFKNGRGLIGATASVAWTPVRDRTFELITYRKKEKWGNPRFVDDVSTKKMDKIVSSTFDNYDYENHHNRLVPNSPCPVLYGVRGENPVDLFKAKSIVKSEKVDSWIIFETNQGTDDHLQEKNIRDIQPYDSVITQGVVSKEPFTLQGGHVVFEIKDETGFIDCAAYEPTKQFRKIVRKLIPGDMVEVYGGVRETPFTVNLEKIRVKMLVEKYEKVENPVCPVCGKHMKSIGRNQGYRCIKCGSKSNYPIVKRAERGLKPGFYEVPVCARRHISKPLKRIKRENGESKLNHKSF